MKRTGSRAGAFALVVALAVPAWFGLEAVQEIGRGTQACKKRHAENERKVRHMQAENALTREYIAKARAGAPLPDGTRGADALRVIERRQQWEAREMHQHEHIDQPAFERDCRPLI